MRWLLIVLICFILLLQYSLWVGEGSLAHKHSLQREVIVQQKKNETLREENLILASEVKNIKGSMEGIEGVARKNLGMIKNGETFYMVIEKKD